MKKTIAVTALFEDEYRQALREAAPECEIIYGVPTDAEFDKITIFIGAPRPDTLDKMPSLEWIQLTMAGTEPYSRPGVLRAGVLLTNASGAYGLAISEHMTAAVTMLCKRLHLYRDNQNKGLWLDRGNVKQIEGATVLVIGMGDIGGNFARRMKGLGCYVIGVRRAKTGEKPPYVDELYAADALDSLLPRADIAALSLPNTPLTAGLVTRERLALLKDGAVLVNVGRGNAVDTEALCDALESGKLWGAALDVTDPEPLPPDHRLWHIENALITPHISGYYHLRKTYENIMDIVIGNVKRYMSGQEMIRVVDLSAGY
jgi:phosphoglycerate dehydrogenase-like enzyme